MDIWENTVQEDEMPCAWALTQDYANESSLQQRTKNECK